MRTAPTTPDSFWLPASLLFTIFIFSLLTAGHVNAAPHDESVIAEENGADISNSLPSEPFVDHASIGTYSDHITLVGVGQITMPDDNCPSYPRPRSISTDERLTIQSKDGWIPNLAKEVRHLDDNALIVELRRAEWSDGTPFLASDVVFSVDVAREHPAISPLLPLAEVHVEKQGDYRVKFDLPSNIDAPLAFLHYIRLLPKHIFPDDGQLGESTISCLTQGTSGYLEWPTVGAYMLTDIDIENRTIRFRRNPSFFKIDKDQQRQPYYNEVIYTLSDALTDLHQAIINVETRTDRPVDVVELPGDFMITLLSGLEGSDGWLLNAEIDVQRSDARGSAVAYYFNYRHGELGRLFRQRSFREATSLAIDRTRVLNTVFHRPYTLMRATTMIVGSQWTSYSLFEPPEHDSDHARTLLDAAKQSAEVQDNIVSLRILASRDDVLLQQAMEAVIEDWNTIGIEATLALVSRSELRAKEKEEEFEIIARSFWLPERWVWESRSGGLVPPFFDDDLDATGQLLTGLACDDDFCEHLTIYRQSLEDWENSDPEDDAEDYKESTVNMLMSHTYYLFAVGAVSDLPRMVFLLNEVRRCSSDHRDGKYMTGGDRYCSDASS